MSATVHRLASPSALLTKQQLAAHLGRSTRWIEMRVRDGMPCVDPTRRFPHRRFRLADVEAWLSDGENRPEARGDRLSRLEAQVARLAATVERLERRTG